MKNVIQSTESVSFNNLEINSAPNLADNHNKEKYKNLEIIFDKFYPPNQLPVKNFYESYNYTIFPFKIPHWFLKQGTKSFCWNKS